MKKFLTIITLFGLLLPSFTFAAIAVRSKQSWATGNQDQTIASIVSGDCVVFIGTVSNNDPVQRAVDAQPTVGGVSMTSILQSTVAGQNNQVDMSILTNASAGTNVTFHTSYHLAPAGFLGSVYVLSGCNTSNALDTSNHAESTGGANPSAAVSTTVANDFLLEGIAGNNTPTVNSGQTSDFTGTGNASSFAQSEKAVTTAQSYTESWTMTSAAYAFGVAAIKPAGAAPAVAGGTVMQIGMGF